VTAITHKRKPVLASIISQVTPSESSVIKRVAYEPLFLSHLRDHLNIKGIKRVVMHEPLTNIRKVIFLEFAQNSPKTEIWRALQGASTLQAACGKIVIAVSEDIDARNADAIFWSLAYRCNPIEDIQIISYRSGGHGPKSGRGTTHDSTMLVDATLKAPVSPIALPARQYMEAARKIWEELKLPRISPQAPWHGYMLGDWAAEWDTYAQRAVTGEWEKSGAETFTQRRSGITPETPVRDVEGGAPSE
jgi:3-polyprenyl-4-hydroxybenzoate decarboxylase